jgi:hypothetical protein
MKDPKSLTKARKALLAIVRRGNLSAEQELRIDEILCGVHHSATAMERNRIMMLPISRYDSAFYEIEQRAFRIGFQTARATDGTLEDAVDEWNKPLNIKEKT